MINLSPFFKSIIDQDQASIVICDLNHTIIYMNPASIKNYAKWGGETLVGKSLMNCHNEKSQEMIIKVTEWFKTAECNDKVHTFFNEKQNKDVYMIALRDENKGLIGYYEKHEFRTKDETPFYEMN
ncbi:MAG: PAS domain-containing protein [Treponema sp.]|nr:PAS domain-containing protein [Treponema sp.]